jgi:hypothetical protein
VGYSRTKVDAEIERIRQHYHKQEKILERGMLDQSYEWTFAQLEREEQDEGLYFVESGRINRITNRLGVMREEYVDLSCWRSNSVQQSAAASAKP